MADSLQAKSDSTEAVVHEVEQSNEIKEISTLRSYEFGGKLVDKAVENFFTEVVGKHVWDTFKSTLLYDYLVFTRYVEITKRNYRADNVKVTLKIPASFIELYSQTTGKSLKVAIGVSKFSRDVTLSGDKMRISSNIFISFFDEATEKIISIIKTSLRNSDVDTVVMFGGLAETCILQHAVQSAFPNTTIVFIEDYLKGAVIVGHTQKCVKKLEMAPKTLMVAAIDFGTTYSGWAFSFISDFESDRTKASTRKWHSGSTQTEKTPTCILIGPDGKTIEAFGYDAEDKYSDLIESGEHLDYYYFHRFKMLLKRKLGEKINREITLEDEMGRSLPALDVFALSIKFLKEDIITSADNRLAGIILKQDIHWVLTVPAIWTDGAKQFMREAAIKAGIESKRLTIALEPEVASIYCRHISVETTVGSTGVSTFKPGTRYMILDAGGGTIDITVHEVDINDGVKEVHSACGGGWGGTMVDKEFENVLIALLSKKIYLQSKREDIEDWLELGRDFEVKKRKVSANNTSPIRMRLPLSLIEMFKEDTGRSLEDAISNNSEYSRDIKLNRDKIQFSDKLSRSLFQGSVDTTVRLVKSILEDKQVTAILMVGGYSDSHMLQQAIKSTFSDIQIVVPLEASYSIMKGALIFGHLPKFITERVLKYTYGIGTNIPFVEGKHPESKRIHTDTGDKCSNIFSKHVEKNQSVKVGEPQVRKSYVPSYKQQKQIRFSVYASEILTPEYTDQNCHLVGRILVDLSDDGDLDREVLVALTFSDTEIVVEATEKKTGKETHAAIDFLG